MTPEEIQDIIIQKIQEEFPRFRLETVCDVADIVGSGWGWEPEYVQSMKNYVETSIEAIKLDEFIRMDEELYYKAEQQDPESIMDFYCNYIKH